MDNFGILGHVDDLQQAASLSDTYSQIHTLLDLLQSVLDAGYSSSYFYVHDEHQKIRSRLINLENGVFEQLSLTSLSSQMDHNGIPSNLTIKYVRKTLTNFSSTASCTCKATPP